jgi:glycerate kinase
MVDTLEEGMAILAAVVGKVTGNDETGAPGAGAAGGLGFCLKSFFHATLLNGMDALIALTGLESRVSEYDLIITGEGKLDEQTGSGKVPMGMLRLGEMNHIPVVCLCGLNESKGKLAFKKVFSIVPHHASLAESIASPDFYLRKLIRQEVVPQMPDLFNNNRNGEIEG